MTRNHKKLRSVIIAICTVPILFVAVKKVPAAFTDPPTLTHIEIDGTDFGPFDSITGLDLFDKDGKPVSSSKIYGKLSLRRNFVTDPSLYLWAKNRRSKKNQLQNIHLVTRGTDGKVLTRQVLEYCQPLSWAVEAANPSLGGFNESVDIAVQRITQE